MKSINEIQDELIDEFSFFTDWMEKYEHIISTGKELDDMPDALKTDDNLVRGCQSRVWLNGKMDGEQLIFEADSDAIITKGLVALMTKVLSGHTPTEIAAAELYFVERIGLKQHLSPNRANGLASMVQKMKYYALAYHAKMNESR